MTTGPPDRTTAAAACAAGRQPGAAAGRSRSRAAPAIVAVRVWPAATYSRVTIEVRPRLVAKQFSCPAAAGGGYRRPGSRSIAARAGGQVQPTRPQHRRHTRGPKHPRRGAPGGGYGNRPPGRRCSRSRVAAYQHRLVFDLCRRGPRPAGSTDLPSACATPTAPRRHHWDSRPGSRWVI